MTSYIDLLASHDELDARTSALIVENTMLQKKMARVSEYLISRVTAILAGDGNHITFDDWYIDHYVSPSQYSPAQEKIDYLQRECEQLREAIGLMTTIKSDMVMRMDDPIGMAAEVERYVRCITKAHSLAQTQLADAYAVTIKLNDKLAKVGEYTFATIAAYERGQREFMSFEEWLEA